MAASRGPLTHRSHPLPVPRSGTAAPRRTRAASIARPCRPASTTSSSSAAAPPGARWPTASAPSPSNRVLVLEAGRPDYRFDVFIHMPAALTFPIGSRYYDWKYESEPEPFMNGRRIYHARGKVLGGSSSINGQIFQRGNPLDYERWAADPGMATWDYAHCLPYFKKMETCLAAAADDPWRGHDGPLVLERGPATNPLFTAFFAACQEAGYHLTEDVNGYRQEGFAAVRPEHPPRTAAERGAGVPAPGDGSQQPRGPDASLRHAHPLRGRAGGRRRRREGPRRRRAHRRRRGHPRGRRDQLAAAPPALGRRPGGRPRGARDPGRRATCPASATTSRTTSRSTSSTRACSRSRCSRRPPRSGVARSSGRSGSSCAAGRARPTTSRAAASRAATTRSRTRT